MQRSIATYSFGELPLREFGNIIMATRALSNLWVNQDSSDC